MQALWPFAAQVAYLLMLLGLLGRDLQLLRKFFLAGSAVALVYSLCSGETTLWVPAVWNAAFLLLNGVHVGLNRAQQRREKLDTVEQFLKRTAFSHMPVEHLKSFTRIGMEGVVKAGQPIVKTEGP